MVNRLFGLAVHEAVASVLLTRWTRDGSGAADRTLLVSGGRAPEPDARVGPLGDRARGAGQRAAPADAGECWSGPKREVTGTRSRPAGTAPRFQTGASPGTLGPLRRPRAARPEDWRWSRPGSDRGMILSTLRPFVTRGLTVAGSVAAGSGAPRPRARRTLREDLPRSDCDAGAVIGRLVASPCGFFLREGPGGHPVLPQPALRDLP